MARHAAPAAQPASKRFRDRAEELRAVASEVRDPTVGDDLRRYAEEWDRLAVFAEQDEDRAWRQLLIDSDWGVSRFTR